MNPQQELDLLNTIMDELIAAVEEVMQSGEPILDELRGYISEEIEITTARIIELQDQIRGQQSPVDGLAPQETHPQLDPGPFPSSNVNAFKYDPRSKRLFVKFHGQDSSDGGPTYLYNNIPKNIYDVFAKGGVSPKTSGQNQYHRWIKGVTPSLGAALNALIKEGGYPYQRIE